MDRIKNPQKHYEDLLKHKIDSYELLIALGYKVKKEIVRLK